MLLLINFSYIINIIYYGVNLKINKFSKFIILFTIRFNKYLNFNKLRIRIFEHIIN